MSAKPDTRFKSSLAAAAVPLSFLIGGAVAALISHVFDWHMLGVSFGVFLGSMVGFACWAIFAVPPIAAPKRPNLAEAAGDEYWRAYVVANEGLGQNSPSADAAAKELKQSQAWRANNQPMGTWSARFQERFMPQSTYLRQARRNESQTRSIDLVGEVISDFAREHLSANMSNDPEYVTDYNWRSEIKMPVFQQGQSAASYWAQFDQVRQGADQLTYNERLSASVTGQLPAPERDRIPAQPRFDPVRTARVTQGDNDETSVPAHARTYETLPPHLALIEETNLIRKRLAQASNVHSGDLGLCLGKMSSSVDAIIAGLKDNPLKLIEVQRLFTYYLPEVGNLLKAREQMNAIAQYERVTEIDTILLRIQSAFAAFARRMHDADIRALDIDLKLLDQSLAAEFETQNGN
jgi:hypothetical protein